MKAETRTTRTTNVEYIVYTEPNVRREIYANPGSVTWYLGSGATRIDMTPDEARLVALRLAEMADKVDETDKADETKW